MSGGGGSRRMSLIVRGLSRETDPTRVRKYFEHFGEVRDVYLPRDYYTGERRGFGFVEFFDERDADEALRALSQRASLDGREITVGIAKQGRKSPDTMKARERERVDTYGGSSSGTGSGGSNYYKGGRGDRYERRRGYSSYSRSPSYEHSNRRRHGRDSRYYRGRDASNSDEWDKERRGRPDDRKDGKGRSRTPHSRSRTGRRKSPHRSGSRSRSPAIRRSDSRSHNGGEEGRSRSEADSPSDVPNQPRVASARAGSSRSPTASRSRSRSRSYPASFENNAANGSTSRDLNNASHARPRTSSRSWSRTSKENLDDSMTGNAGGERKPSHSRSRSVSGSK